MSIRPTVDAPRLRLGVENPLLAAPLKSYFARMQSVVRQDQPPPLLRRHTVLDQREIQILVASINLVAHYRVPEVRQVNPYLVFSPRPRLDQQEAEG